MQHAKVLLAPLAGAELELVATVSWLVTPVVVCFCALAVVLNPGQRMGHMCVGVVVVVVAAAVRKELPEEVV